jgi:hypothetical protein
VTNRRQSWTINTLKNVRSTEAIEGDAWPHSRGVLPAALKAPAPFPLIVKVENELGCE